MSKAPRRIAVELQNVLKSQPDGMVIEADASDVFKWSVTMAGPV